MQLSNIHQGQDVNHNKQSGSRLSKFGEVDCWTIYVPCLLSGLSILVALPKLGSKEKPSALDPEEHGTNQSYAVIFCSSIYITLTSVCDNVTVTCIQSESIHSRSKHEHESSDKPIQHSNDTTTNATANANVSFLLLSSAFSQHRGTFHELVLH